MSLFRRRLMMQGKENYTYENAAYIYNASTAYIDTGFTPNQDTRVVLDFSISGHTSISGGGNFATIFGSGNRNSNNAYIVFLNISSGHACQPQYRGDYQSNNGSLTYGTRYTIDFNKNVFRCRANHTFTYNTFTCPTTLCLCNIKSRTFHRAQCTIYSCKIYDNDILVRDFVPKLRSDGKYGLWDNVEGKFYLSPNDVLFEGSLTE